VSDRIAWIGVDPEPGDERSLGDVYTRLGLPATGAGLDHVLRIHAKMPATLDQHLGFYRGIMREPGPLSRIECEVIGVVVSQRNSCHY
jgi:hypothetical protein